MGQPFRHRMRVRYIECDAQGVVFNAHYLAYFDVAITELWREAFGSYQEMFESGFDVVVAETTLRYRDGLRFDDEFDVAVSTEKLGDTSLTLGFRVERDGGDLCVEGQTRYVCVRAGTTDKISIPDDIRAGLERYS